MMYQQVIAQQQAADQREQERVQREAALAQRAAQEAQAAQQQEAYRADQNRILAEAAAQRDQQAQAIAAQQAQIQQQQADYMAMQQKQYEQQQAYQAQQSADRQAAQNAYQQQMTDLIKQTSQAASTQQQETRQNVPSCQSYGVGAGLSSNTVRVRVLRVSVVVIRLGPLLRSLRGE